VYNWRLGEVWLKRGCVSMVENSVQVSERSTITRNVTVICYFLSLLSFGMGYSEMLVYKNIINEHVINTYDYTVNLSLATSFLVLTIFLAVIGFIFYTLRIMESGK